MMVSKIIMIENYSEFDVDDNFCCEIWCFHSGIVEDSGLSSGMLHCVVGWRASHFSKGHNIYFTYEHQKLLSQWYCITSQTLIPALNRSCHSKSTPLHPWVEFHNLLVLSIPHSSPYNNMYEWEVSCLDKCYKSLC